MSKWLIGLLLFLPAPASADNEEKAGRILSKTTHGNHWFVSHGARLLQEVGVSTPPAPAIGGNVARRKPKMTPLTVSVEEGLMEWLAQSAVEKNQTVERRVQRLLELERKTDQRRKETAARLAHV